MSDIIPAVSGGGKKGKKVQLVGLVVVVAIIGYLAFAYKKKLFPFKQADDAIKKSKEAIDKLASGPSAPTLPNPPGMAGPGAPIPGVSFPLGSGMGTGATLQPGGGTGSLDFTGQGGVTGPQVKPDPTILSTFQQGLYKQLFLPYDRYPYLYGQNYRQAVVQPTDLLQNTNNPYATTFGYRPPLQGGDIPPQPYNPNTSPALQQQYSQNLYDAYGYYGPGGGAVTPDSSYMTQPYSPFGQQPPNYGYAATTTTTTPPAGHTWPGGGGGQGGHTGGSGGGGGGMGDDDDENGRDNQDDKDNEKHQGHGGNWQGGHSGQGNWNWNNGGRGGSANEWRMGKWKGKWKGKDKDKNRHEHREEDDDPEFIRLRPEIKIKIRKAIDDADLDPEQFLILMRNQNWWSRYVPIQYRALILRLLQNHGMHRGWFKSGMGFGGGRPGLGPRPRPGFGSGFGFGHRPPVRFGHGPGLGVGFHGRPGMGGHGTWQGQGQKVHMVAGAHPTTHANRAIEAVARSARGGLRAYSGSSLCSSKFHGKCNTECRDGCDDNCLDCLSACGPNSITESDIARRVAACAHIQEPDSSVNVINQVEFPDFALYQGQNPFAQFPTQQGLQQQYEQFNNPFAPNDSPYYGYGQGMFGGYNPQQPPPQFPPFPSQYPNPFPFPGGNGGGFPPPPPGNPQQQCPPGYRYDHCLCRCSPNQAVNCLAYRPCPGDPGYGGSTPGYPGQQPGQYNPAVAQAIFSGGGSNCNPSACQSQYRGNCQIQCTDPSSPNCTACIATCCANSFTGVSTFGLFGARAKVGRGRGRGRGRGMRHHQGQGHVGDDMAVGSEVQNDMDVTFHYNEIRKHRRNMNIIYLPPYQKREQYEKMKRHQNEYKKHRMADLHEQKHGRNMHYFNKKCEHISNRIFGDDADDYEPTAKSIHNSFLKKIIRT